MGVHCWAAGCTSVVPIAHLTGADSSVSDSDSVDEQLIGIRGGGSSEFDAELDSESESERDSVDESESEKDSDDE